MSAPEGNQYWKFRDKHGPDFKYTEESLWKEAVSYFEWISRQVWNRKDAIKSGESAGTLIDIPTSTPMSIKGFCIYADITEQTFLNYQSNEDPWKGLFEVSMRIRQIIETQQFEGATVGAYNPNIIARTLGLSDKVQQEHSGEIKTGDAIDYSKLSKEALIEIEKAKK